MTITNVLINRGVITITIEGGKEYRIDINKRQVLGLRGTPIRTIPFASALYNLPTHTDTVLRIMYYGIYHGRKIDFNVLALADRFRSAGIFIEDGISFLRDKFDYINKNFAKIVAYLKESGSTSIQDYVQNKQKEEWCAEYGLEPTEENKQFVFNLCNRITFDNLSPAQKKKAVAYLLTAKLYEFNGFESLYKIRDYFNWCDTMNKPYEKTNNFVREYVETKRTYELRKKEFDAEAIRNHLAKHSKAFNFTYGNYTVVLPTCGQDIVTEGDRMHHCVGGYVQKVVEGKENIIFIRNINNPEQCYITCEVFNDGQIGQYFLAYDKRITSEEDIEFRAKLQEHLYANW